MARQGKEASIFYVLVEIILQLSTRRATATPWEILGPPFLTISPLQSVFSEGEIESHWPDSHLQLPSNRLQLVFLGLCIFVQECSVRAALAIAASGCSDGLV